MGMLKKLTDAAAFRKYPPVAPARIAFVADLHGASSAQKEKLRTLKEGCRADIICLLGDIPADMAAMVRRHNAGDILYVLGNHDTWGSYDGIPGLLSANRSILHACGIVFAGLSGSIRYNDDADWCFLTQEESSACMAELPPCGILITHDAPYGLMGAQETHCGLIGLREYVEARKPKYHVFGHHHRPYEGFIGGTKEICVYGAAVLDTETGAVEQVM